MQVEGDGSTATRANIKRSLHLQAEIERATNLYGPEDVVTKSLMERHRALQSKVSAVAIAKDSVAIEQTSLTITRHKANVQDHLRIQIEEGQKHILDLQKQIVDRQKELQRVDRLLPSSPRVLQLLAHRPHPLVPLLS